MSTLAVRGTIHKQIILLSQTDSQWVVHESEFNRGLNNGPFWSVPQTKLSHGFRRLGIQCRWDEICNTSIVLSNPFWSFKVLVHTKMKILIFLSCCPICTRLWFIWFIRITLTLKDYFLKCYSFSGMDLDNWQWRGIHLSDFNQRSTKEWYDGK